MSRSGVRLMALAAYSVGWLLIVIPLMDSMVNVWPFDPSTALWRFGALGSLSRAIMTPLLGLLVAMGVASMMQHRISLRIHAVLAMMGACLLMVMGGVFILEAVTVRSQATAEAARAFDIAAVLAAMKYFAGTAVLTVMGYGGWSLSRTKAVEVNPSEGLVFGR